MSFQNRKGEKRVFLPIGPEVGRRHWWKRAKPRRVPKEDVRGGANGRLVSLAKKNEGKVFERNLWKKRGISLRLKMDKKIWKRRKEKQDNKDKRIKKTKKRQQLHPFSKLKNIWCQRILTRIFLTAGPPGALKPLARASYPSVMPFPFKLIERHDS